MRQSAPLPVCGRVCATGGRFKLRLLRAAESARVRTMSPSCHVPLVPRPAGRSPPPVELFPGGELTPILCRDTIHRSSACFPNGHGPGTGGVVPVAGQQRQPTGLYCGRCRLWRLGHLLLPAAPPRQRSGHSRDARARQCSACFCWPSLRCWQPSDCYLSPGAQNCNGANASSILDSTPIACATRKLHACHCRYPATSWPSSAASPGQGPGTVRTHHEDRRHRRQRTHRIETRHQAPRPGTRQSPRHLAAWASSFMAGEAKWLN